MNDKKTQNGRWQKMNYVAIFAGLCTSMMLAGSAASAEEAKAETKVAEAKPTAAKKVTAKKKVTKKTHAKEHETKSSMSFAPQVNVPLNKSTLVKLPTAVSRVSVGNPEVADVILLGDREVYLLGKKMGATNIIVWGKNGRSRVIDVAVGMDFTALQTKLRQMLPGSKNIKVGIANDSLVLSGSVPDTVKVDKAMALAEAYAGKKVVNMLQAGAPQQVMLEVKIAEISKTLLDKMGVNIYANWSRVKGSSNFLMGDRTSVNPILSLLARNGNKGADLTADRENDLVRILAEPTIVALSGQEGAFLAGGKIYIPVPQSSGNSTTITLEEKEFGIGLKFTPTVLEGGLIHLRVTPEVSEVSSTGTAVQGTASTVTTVLGVSTTTTTPQMLLPTITTRRASTTVQLYDGQSFAIGGLIKDKTVNAIKGIPGLSDLPILGALFRSNEFQSDRTELLFVVTPRLVKPLPPNYALPTDNLTLPDRKEFFLEGKMEGDPGKHRPQPNAQQPEAIVPQDETKPDGSGFQMK